jgi:hypothetical protein
MTAANRSSEQKERAMSEGVVHYWPGGDVQTVCGLDLFSPNTRYVMDWADVTCGDCRLEQPAQKVPGRVEYEIPAEVQRVDALLAATDRRARAARKVVKWTARLESALAEERRLTDAPVQLRGQGTLLERLEQLRPFKQRVQELLPVYGPLKAKQAALDEAHGQALEIEQRRERGIPPYPKLPY